MKYTHLFFNLMIAITLINGLQAVRPPRDRIPLTMQIMRAVSDGNIAFVQDLIKENPSLRYTRTYPDRLNLLTLANGNLEMTSYLLGSGVRVAQESKNGDTVLEKALKTLFFCRIRGRRMNQKQKKERVVVIHRLISSDTTKSRFIPNRKGFLPAHNVIYLALIDFDL